MGFIVAIVTHTGFCMGTGEKGQKSVQNRRPHSAFACVQDYIAIKNAIVRGLV